MSYQIFKTLSRIPYASDANIEKLYNSSMYANYDYAVTWYGRIASNNQGQLTVEVFLVSLSSEFYTKINVPLTYIAKMPIGSIWRNGVCTQKLVIGDGEHAKILSTMRHTNIEGSIDTNIVYHHPMQDGSKLKPILDKHYPIVRSQDGLFVFQDYNTLLIVPIASNKNSATRQQRLIVHPLLFLNAHYGVSKRINQILMTHLWRSDNRNGDLKTVTSELELDYHNPNCPNAVLIPDHLVIGDAVFLYYLKNHAITQHIVKKFNAEIRKNLTRHDKPFSYLNHVQPYHTQPIDIECRYIQLDDQTLLCTEITGISMPQGEAIYYDLQDSKIRHSDGRGNDSNQTRHTFKPLFLDRENQEFYLVNTAPNNKNKTVVRQSIKTIGEIRQLFKNATINIAQATQQGEVVPITEPLPSQYGAGTRIGSAGKTGILQTLVGKSHQYDKDEYGVCDIDSQYEKLLKYAQYVKNNKQKYGYTNVLIDCYSLANGLLGEVIKPIIFKHDSQKRFPYSVYLLRLQLDNDVFFFLDCESTEKQASSGIVVKVDDETQFLGDYLYSLEALVRQLSNNQGRLESQIFNKLKQKHPDQIIQVARYKHMNEDVSNWVLTGVGKF